MEKCMRCDHELILSGNFMRSEIIGEDLPEDDDCIVTNAVVQVMIFMIHRKAKKSYTHIGIVEL